MVAGHRISWLVEGHIILSVSPEESTVEEMPVLDAEYLAYIEQGKADLVHFIFDVSQQKKMPTIKAMRALTFIRHPKFGWSILVGEVHPLIKTLTILVAKMQRGRFRIMDTTQDAHEFLLAMYPAIIPSSQTDVEHS